MRIISFPGGDPRGPPGHVGCSRAGDRVEWRDRRTPAESWRELRDDVRALAPAMTPAFEQRLRERLAETEGRRRRRSRFSWARALPRARIGAAMASVAVVVAAAVATLVIGLGGPQRSGSGSAVPPLSALRKSAGPVIAAKATEHVRSTGAAAGQVGSAATLGEEVKANAQGLAPAASAAAGATGRVQQLAASVSLSTSLGNVQNVSEGVARLAARDEGYVQQSHVQVQQHGSGEANLTLKLPSARLAAALAAIARLAPVSSESQSLQDITNEYEAAHQRLADARAERQALLRALASATSEGQIDSLRERLSQARNAITRDQAAVQSLSQRASTAEVEVTVLASTTARHTTSAGLTLHSGLHDAVRVLTVVLVAILIAAAVLVPVALLIAALAAARSFWGAATSASGRSTWRDIFVSSDRARVGATGFRVARKKAAGDTFTYE